MKDWFTRVLTTYHFFSLTEFVQSLWPSRKPEYDFSILLMTVSACWAAIDGCCGLDNAAFIALLVVFVTEFFSGIAAARIRKETISSLKMSRFGLKVACYLVMICVSYVMAASFKNHDKQVMAWSFSWLHMFLVGQIVLENIVSILENLATISGKDKSAWISQIRNLFASKLGGTP